MFMSHHLRLSTIEVLHRFNCSCKCLSTSSTCQKMKRGYAGSWTNSVRLQNPEIVKEMPNYEFVKAGNTKTRNLVYVCGHGSLGSLGMPQYYKPEKKDPDELKQKDVFSSTFRRLGSFCGSDTVNGIACGYGFTILTGKFEETNHTALGFGLNNQSQIGYQESRPGYPLEIVSTPLPIYLPTKEPILRVSCGRGHSILRDKLGRVFSLGNNSFGQCGRPINEKEEYFGSKKAHSFDNSLPANIDQVECGQDHSMFLTDDGKLFACGWGADGQTGLGHYNNQHEPAQVKGDIEGVKIVKVSSFADTVLALDDQGNVFGWGNTEYAQFRTLANCESEQFNVPRHLKFRPAIPGKIVDIAAGGTICALLNDAGQVFVWGFGILGKGPDVDSSSRPLLLPETLFGMNIYNPDTKVTKIYASLSHFAAINSNFDLYTWGKNRGEALGFKHASNQFFPMKVNMNSAHVREIALGVDHTCALVNKVF